MSISVAESLTEVGAVDQEDIARRFAEDYRWSRGYGPGAARVLRRIRRGMHWRQAARSVYPEGSYGNGAAMRSPVLAVAFSGETLLEAASEVAVITHAHELGVEGAQLLAAAVDRTLADDSAEEVLRHLLHLAKAPVYTKKLTLASEWFGHTESPQALSVRSSLGCGVAATDSCVTAIFLGLEFGNRPFDELLSMVVKVGGDVDTIGAMASAIWGARRGERELPVPLRQRLEDEQRIVQVASRLHERFAARAKRESGTMA